MSFLRRCVIQKEKEREDKNCFWMNVFKGTSCWFKKSIAENYDVSRLGASSGVTQAVLRLNLKFCHTSCCWFKMHVFVWRMLQGELAFAYAVTLFLAFWSVAHEWIWDVCFRKFCAGLLAPHPCVCLFNSITDDQRSIIDRSATMS